MGFINHPRATASMTVDEPVVVEPAYDVEHPAEVVYSEGFEGTVIIGEGGWWPWEPELASVSSADSHSGTKSLRLNDSPTSEAAVDFNVDFLELPPSRDVERQHTVTMWLLGLPGINVTILGPESVDVEMTGEWLPVTVTGDRWYSFNNWLTVFTTITPSYVGPTPIEVFIDDLTITRNAYTEHVPATYTTTPELKLSDGDLTLDSTRYPYAESSVTIPMPDVDLLEQIKPGQRVIIHGSTTGIFDANFEWNATPGLTADLTLRSREVSHDGKTVVLDLASDEALLYSWSDIVHDSTPRDYESSLRGLVGYVLDKAIPGATLEAGTTDADMTAAWPVRNLLTNPSFEVNTSGWQAGSGTSSLDRSDSSTTPFGSFYAVPRSSGSGRSYVNPTANLRVTPGQMYTFSIYMMPSPSGLTGGVMIRFKNAEGGTVKDVQMTDVALSSTEWTRVYNTVVIPSNISQVSLHPYMVATASGQANRLEAAMFNEGPLEDYVDGYQPATSLYTFAWEDDVDGPSERIPVVERLPELFTWQAGRSAWDFLEPLVAASGFRLFCDEKRNWYLINPLTYSVPGRFSARPGNTVEGSDTMDVDDENNGVTGVVAYFRWTDANGDSREEIDTAGAAGRVKVLEFERQYPGPGIAAAHLSKISGQGRVQDVTTAIDYSIRPGQEVQINLPGTDAQIGTLTKVRWELTSGLMQIGSAGLRDTPPGAIDLLSGTIDALSGTIDEL